MDNNNEVIDELKNRVYELESDKHNLQQEVDENKMDILKLQEVVQRLYDELQSARGDIDELKKRDKDDY
eukprot:SAG22_NODE_3549_length_1649_cov_3.500000_3_plen_69_part_00